ncbi:MAG TPA: hypothetical protein PLI34_12605 [Saprospiraceae bacterium]|nr:hypothetical protein [Saprospiraceae bacterium]
MQKQAVAVIVEQQPPRVIDALRKQAVNVFVLFEQLLEVPVVEINKSEPHQGEVAIEAVQCFVVIHLREPVFPVKGLGRVFGVLIDDVFRSVVHTLKDLLAVFVLRLEFFQKLIGLPVLCVPHTDEQKMAIHGYQFVKFDKVEIRLLVVPDRLQ